MPTTKRRINITVDDDLYAVLEDLSQKEEESISSVTLVLIQRALELKEDFYFSQISDERLSKRQRRISHKRAWK